MSLPQEQLKLWEEAHEATMQKKSLEDGHGQLATTRRFTMLI
jgi:hypothetical protein